MKKLLAILLSTGIILSMFTIPISASISGTDIIVDASPSELGNDIRVTDKYASTTSARLTADSSTKWQVQLEHESNEHKEYYINKSVISFEDNVENLTVRVNGKPINHTTTMFNGHEWIRFTESSKDVTVTINADLGGGTSGFITRLKLLVVGNPIGTALVISIVSLFAFGAVALWRKPIQWE